MKILKVRHYKVGYEVRTELHDGKEYECDDFEVQMAYTPTGDFIGSPKDAFYLCRTQGIKPEKAQADHNTCSIGFSEQKGKWFGWSHRAIFGFQPGDMVKEGDCTAEEGWTDEYLTEHPEERRALPVGFTAHTMIGARQMALAFAASVS